MTLEAILKQFDIDSIGFDNGKSALECFRQRLAMTCCSRTFKLVLTDISMPFMDGFDVCTEIVHTQKYWY